MAQVEAIEKFQGEFLRHSTYEAPSSTGYSSIYWSLDHHALARDKEGDYWRLVTSDELNSIIDKINSAFTKITDVCAKQEAKMARTEGLATKFTQLREVLAPVLQLDGKLANYSTATDAKLKKLTSDIQELREGSLEQLKRELDTSLTANLTAKLADSQAMMDAKFAELQLDAKFADVKGEQEAKLQQLKSEVDTKLNDMLQVDTKLADHQATMVAKLTDLKVEQEAKLQQHRSELEKQITDMQLDTKLADHHATIGAKVDEVKEKTISDLQLDAKLANLSSAQEEKLQQFKSELDSKIASIQKEEKLQQFKSELDSKIASMQKESVVTARAITTDESKYQGNTNDAKFAVLEAVHEEQFQQLKMHLEARITNLQEEIDNRRSLFCFGRSEP
mmetsp:Transcript_100218/g.192285  ORF Transcript_100218/g.192285 Transcript_100218/m.192285 type:complete len:392 (-) Transcript_100218:177-1352(-)